MKSLRMKPLMLLLALAAAGAAQAAAGDAPPASSGRAAAPSARRLVVCADPNNLPFSNRARQGFENKIVDLLARDLKAQVSYVWWAQRRGYVRNTLNEAKCDVWPGVASGVSMVETTRPYYRSTYVFLTRAAAPLHGLTLDDSRLKNLSIGVQMVGNDAMNTPPAHAIASRGLIDNVRGYMLYGNYDQPNPPSAIINAVAQGDVDVALVWGPLAGYFAGRSAVPLRSEPVTPALDPRWPMTYDISMGVQRKNGPLRAEIDAVLGKEKSAIDAILCSYHVPQLMVRADSTL